MLAPALLGGATVAAPTAPTAVEIIRTADRIRAPADAFSFEVSLLSPESRPGDPAARLHVYVKGRERTLAKFLHPANERGKLLLMVGPNLWVFLPATERPLRISPLQRLVGDISHADVLRVNFEGDYTARLDGEEEVDGTPAYRLELTGRVEGVTYDRVRYWVERASGRPLRAEFFAVSGIRLKTARFTRYAVALGAARPAEVEVQDAVRGDRVSRIVYANYRLETLRDEVFQPSYLKYVK
jgi:outer membrane lipoprotein-sorting protein